jgi:hypothetical protein
LLFTGFAVPGTVGHSSKKPPARRGSEDIKKQPTNLSDSGATEI